MVSSVLVQADGGRGSTAVLVVQLAVLVALVATTAKVSIDVAKSFGKGVDYGLRLWLLQPVFYPSLGFGDATYHGPVYKGRPSAPSGRRRPVSVQAVILLATNRDPMTTRTVDRSARRRRRVAGRRRDAIAGAAGTD